MSRSPSPTAAKSSEPIHTELFNLFKGLQDSIDGLSTKLATLEAGRSSNVIQPSRPNPQGQRKHAFQERNYVPSTPDMHYYPNQYQNYVYEPCDYLEDEG